MRAGALSCVALSLLAACEEPPEPCDPAPTLLEVDPVVPVSEGGRAFLRYPARPDVEVTVAGLAPGFTSRIEQGAAGAGVVVVGAPYGITGALPAELIATCDDGHALALPITLDVRPLVATVLSARGAPDTPEPRSFAGMAIVGGALVVVGGDAAGAPLDDAWSLDLTSRAWSRLGGGLPSGASGALAAHAVPLHDEVLVQDATGGAVLLALDGTATSIDVTGAVPSRTRGAALVFHPDSATFLSLCGAGVSNEDVHCDISGLNLESDRTIGTWSAVQPSGFAPLGRTHAVAGYDGERRRVVLYGGARADGPGQDAWALDVDGLPQRAVAFARLGKEEDDPIPRAYACGAVDPVGHRFLVVGGTSGTAIDGSDAVAVAAVSSLELGRDDARWRTAPVRDMPAPTVGCTATYDAERQRLIVGFGHDEDGDTNAVWAIGL